MIKNDVKSGVSVPEALKPTRTKTSTTANPQGIDPGTHEVALATSSMSDSFFELVAGIYAQNGMTVRRTDWRDGPVTYFVILDDQVREHRSLVELYRIHKVWEKDHA